MRYLIIFLICLFPYTVNANSWWGDMQKSVYDTDGNSIVDDVDLLDEDNMATDSATKAASQQSIKAYVGNTFLPLAGGTLTGEATVDDLGLQFTEGDTLTDCSTFSATGGGIYYDDSEGKFKKCQDNVLTDMDTGGAETNDLEGDGAANIADTEIPIGTGAGTANYATLSGDATMTNAGVVTVVDDSHNHVSGNIDNFTDSIVWNAAAMTVDGTQCATPVKDQINSGPFLYKIICTDNDASEMSGHVIMSDGWDAGTVTFEVEYLQTAADTNALNMDIACMCRGTGETVNNTWGTEVAIDDAAVSGSSVVDLTTSAAVTCNGTCAAGDVLIWRLEVDATGTTTAMATLNFLGLKMEYTGGLGD